jgi:hypothetical protein
MSPVVWLIRELRQWKVNDLVKVAQLQMAEQLGLSYACLWILPILPTSYWGQKLFVFLKSFTPFSCHTRYKIGYIWLCVPIHPHSTTVMATNSGYKSHRFWENWISRMKMVNFCRWVLLIIGPLFTNALEIIALIIKSSHRKKILKNSFQIFPGH